jgi:cytochrome P450
MTAVVRPLLRTRLFEIVGGEAVTDNNRLIDFAISQVEAQSGNIQSGEKDPLADPNNLLSRLVNTRDKKTGWQPTRADLDTESLNLMNAGQDPYSGALAALIFYLVHNADALEKATREVR